MVHDNKISNNVLQCLNPSQRVVIVQTEKNNLGTIGTLDSNDYCNPYTDRLVNIAYTPGYSVGNSTMRYNSLSLADWQGYGYEPHGHIAYDYPTAYAAYSKIGSDQVQNSTFNSSTGWWWTYGNANFTISADNSNTAMDGGSLKGQYATDTTLQVGNWGTSPITITNGNTYLLTYSLQSTGNGGMQVIINMSGAPYTNTTIPFGTTQNFTPSRAEDTLLFYGNMNATASLVFNSTNADGTFWMDNVDFYEVTADTSHSSPYRTSILFTNPSSSSYTISSAGKYRDINGSILSQDVTLAPFTSVVLKSLTAIPTGVISSKTASAASVYPNPSSGSFTLVTSKTISSVVAVNSLGQQVYQKANTSVSLIQLGNSWTTGMYLIQLNYADGSQETLKVVKE